MNILRHCSRTYATCLVLDRTEETGLLLGSFTAGVEDSENLQTRCKSMQYHKRSKHLTFMVTGCGEVKWWEYEIS